MKTRFEWQIEPEEEDTALAGPARHATRRVGWMAVLLLVTAALVALRLYAHQAQMERAAREDVAAAFELLSGAVQKGDEELFGAALAGADLAARRSQKLLWQANLLWERPALGLRADTNARPIQDIRISPDLTLAELTFAQVYGATRQEAVAKPVRLLQTIPFARVGRAWSPAVFSEDFWGETQQLDAGPLSVTYPARDSAIVRRLASDLGDALAAWCRENSSAVPGSDSGLCRNGRYPLQFSPAPESLLRLAGADASVRVGELVPNELPAPSLVGLPIDEAAYQALSQAYVRVFMGRLREQTIVEGTLPDQTIRALCFAFPQRGQRLFRYDFARAGWWQELTASGWELLAAAGDETAVLLDDGHTIHYWGGADGHALFSVDGSIEPDNVQPLGWTATEQRPLLLFQQTAVADPATRFRWLDPRACQPGDCALAELDGYPTVAPDGRHTLLQSASELLLGDAAGMRQQVIGQGFTPFWVDDERFGFVRFGSLGEGRTGTEIVIGRVDAPDLHVLLDGDELARAAAVEDGGELFVDYVVPRPGGADELLISATGIRAVAGEYFIFTATLAEDGARVTPRLQLQRAGAPGGLSGRLTPTGLPPFLVSGDGRWLALTELLGHHKETWTILVHDLEEGATRQVADNVPAMPGYFPLLDWSADGRWLLVADRQALRLLDPAREVELTIAHEFDGCTAVIWSS